MRKTRVFVNQPLAAGDHITLANKARHHIGVVLRKQPGDVLELFNGDGCNYVAVIEFISNKALTVSIRQQRPATSESPLHIHLGQALSQNQRFDLAVQKTTELGVSRITPLLTEHSQKPAARQLGKKLKHWQQIATSAAEQSHRARVPTIETPITLAEWLEQAHGDVKWLCAINRQQPVQPHPHEASSLSLLVGPEGGFSTGEQEQALEQQFQAVNLGRRVLRTETAPVVAISLAQAWWGDLCAYSGNGEVV